MYLTVKRVVTTITVFLAVVCAVSLLVLTVGTTVDTLRRYLLGRGLPASVDYAEIVLIVLAYGTLAETARQKGHVAIGLLADRLPRRLALTLELLGLGLVLVTLSLLAAESLSIARASMASGELRPGMAQIPAWPARLTIAVGLAALVLQLAVQLVTAVRRLLSGEEALPSEVSRSGVEAGL
jgi:TRAP-type C4-dicarboxylate transport system permease small subunit